MTQLNTFVIIDTIRRFRVEVIAFRNARDWAKKQRDKIIVIANDSVIKSSRDTFNLELSIYIMS
jgi:hypothetical protein